VAPDGPSTSHSEVGGPAPRERLAATLAERLGRLRLGRFSGIYLILIFILIFGLWIPSTFLTVTTAQTIGNDQAITVILALGVLLSLSAGQFDLSVAQNLGLGAAICIKLIAVTHLAALVAVLISVAACTACGVGNAILVVNVGLDSFIATLGTSSVLLALTEIITANNYVGPTPQSFSSFVSWQPLGIPVLAIYAVVAAVLVWYVLEHTPVGRKIYATGANPDTARLSGIPINRYKACCLIATAFMAGVAGVLLAAQLGTVSSDVGPPYLLPTFAACFLSTTQLKPGRFNVWGMIVAVLLLAIGIKGLVLAGGPEWITDMFNGVALLVAVGLAVTFQRRRVKTASRRTLAKEQRVAGATRQGSGGSG
jgi:ribose transport system permease protein